VKLLNSILIGLLVLGSYYHKFIVDDLVSRNESLTHLASSNEDEIISLQSKVKELDVPCPAPPLCLPEIVEGPERDIYYSQCNGECPRCDEYEY